MLCFRVLLEKKERSKKGKGGDWDVTKIFFFLYLGNFFLARLAPRFQREKRLFLTFCMNSQSAFGLALPYG